MLCQCGVLSCCRVAVNLSLILLIENLSRRLQPLLYCLPQLFDFFHESSRFISISFNESSPSFVYIGLLLEYLQWSEDAQLVFSRFFTFRLKYFLLGRYRLKAASAFNVLIHTSMLHVYQCFWRFMVYYIYYVLYTYLSIVLKWRVQKTFWV